MLELAPAPLAPGSSTAVLHAPLASVRMLDFDLTAAEPARLVVVQDAAPSAQAVRRAKLLVTLVIATMIIVIPLNVNTADAQGASAHANTASAT